ncbi:MAG: ATP-binding protein [Geitlerinemataceae cyanobacterium]
MSYFHTLAWRHTLHASTLDRLQAWLCETILGSPDGDRLIVGHGERWEGLDSRAHLTIALSERVCAVVLGVRCAGDGEAARIYDTEIAFDREAVARFLEAGNPIWNDDDAREIRRRALEVSKRVRPPEGLVRRCVLELIAAWEAEHDAIDMHVSAARDESVPIDFDPTSRLAEDPPTERPIGLADILRDTIGRARAFLQLDRLAIYQFSRSGHNSNEPAGRDGSILYEALAVPAIESLQACDLEVAAGLPPRHILEHPQPPLAIADVFQAEPLSDRTRQALAQMQVRAQAVAPLFVGENLWGVLLAHQQAARNWSHSDLDFLGYVARDMSLAVEQGHAIAEIQHQKYLAEQSIEHHAQELENAIRNARAARQTRTEFLSMMSHELRTPLACIIGMSSTLLRWSLGALNDKQREYLQTVYDSGEHLLELIDDLLDLTELESGATQLNVTDFSLSNLARHLIRAAIDRATLHGIQLDLRLDIPEGLDRFRADRARINQILFNLLSNAIKFTQAGGYVTLHVTRRRQQVVFALEDTGIGIPKHQQALLFESFRQLDGTYTREYGGTGLGLALTKQLVELHGGKIEVESEPDVGSCFTVSLPQLGQAPPLPSAPAPPTRAAHPSRGHIVLIGSHEEDATLICDVLTAAGLQVIWMLDGATALEQIRVLRPVVAIVDRRLDGSNGDELIALLRDSYSREAMRIVVFGNDRHPEDEARCLASGADRCVAVPLHIEQLLAHALELLGQSYETVPAEVAAESRLENGSA